MGRPAAAVHLDGTGVLSLRIVLPPFFLAESRIHLFHSCRTSGRNVIGLQVVRYLRNWIHINRNRGRCACHSEEKKVRQLAETGWCSSDSRGLDRKSLSAKRKSRSTEDREGGWSSNGISQCLGDCSGARQIFISRARRGVVCSQRVHARWTCSRPGKRVVPAARTLSGCRRQRPGRK